MLDVEGLIITALLVYACWVIFELVRDRYGKRIADWLERKENR